VKEAFTKEVGIVGARLVYPDRTLEHCGIVFEYRTEPQPHFLPRHRYQGYPIEILEANRLEAVPAVTGACLLTSKMIWDDVAGMDEGYVIANFEDVDFNLKVRERGYKVVYQPEATLIHHTAVTLRLLSPQEKEHYMQQNFQRLMTKWYEKLAAGMVMP
jgi:GT2 family glycosyltransferase